MDLLGYALAYHALGLCEIPMKPGTKRPACRKWRHFQLERPPERQLRRWFGNASNLGIAVVLGVVSGFLVCRDYDDLRAYGRWARKYPYFAKILPTVETGRPGRHVYCERDDGRAALYQTAHSDASRAVAAARAGRPDPGDWQAHALGTHKGR